MIQIGNIMADKGQQLHELHLVCLISAHIFSSYEMTTLKQTQDVYKKSSYISLASFPDSDTTHCSVLAYHFRV